MSISPQIHRPRVVAAVVALLVLVAIGSVTRLGTQSSGAVAAAVSVDSPQAHHHQRDAAPHYSAHAIPNGSAQAQRPQGIEPHPALHAIPAIDGAKDPNAISDETALSLLYRTASTRGANGELQASAARTYLKHILELDSLRQAQMALEIVNKFGPQMEAMDARVRNSPSARFSIAQERDIVLRNFSVALADALKSNTFEGQQHVADALLRIKKQTRVFRP